MHIPTTILLCLEWRGQGKLTSPASRFINSPKRNTESAAFSQCFSSVIGSPKEERKAGHFTVLMADFLRKMGSGRGGG